MLSKSPKRKVISYFPSGSSFSDKISPPRELFTLKGRVTLSFISPKSVFERVTTEGFFVSLSRDFRKENALCQTKPSPTKSI